uniref:Uncharacterized protein n=1 Tax=Trypanosoma vivax (strain Y486) TaxID=1055687 RepID=G0TRX5_TRYVY|nr:conserved hypothetical protein [Trypanosoma vivax Y486]
MGCNSKCELQQMCYELTHPSNHDASGENMEGGIVPNGIVRCHCSSSIAMGACASLWALDSVVCRQCATGAKASRRVDLISGSSLGACTVSGRHQDDGMSCDNSNQRADTCATTSGRYDHRCTGSEVGECSPKYFDVTGPSLSNVSVPTLFSACPASALERLADGSSRGENFSDHCEERTVHNDVPCSLPSPSPQQRRLLLCWLCETPSAAAPGWLCAPKLFDASPFPLPSELASANSGRLLEPISLLTLCPRCCTALSMPGEVPPDIVLQRAASTRATLQRTEKYVDFLRNYKMRVEELAASLRLKHSSRPSAVRSDKATDGQHFADFPLQAQRGAFQQLVEMLEFSLQGCVSTLMGGQRDTLLGGSRKNMPLSVRERRVLERELAWIQKRQRTYARAVTDSTHCQGKYCNDRTNSTVLACSGCSHGDMSRNSNAPLDYSAAGAVSPSLHGEGVPNSGDGSGDHTTTIAGAPSPFHVPCDAVNEEERASEKRNQALMARAQERGKKALDRMIERVMTARAAKLKVFETDAGSVEPTKQSASNPPSLGGHEFSSITHSVEASTDGGPPASNPGSRHDDALRNYFEGRLHVVPDFTAAPMEAGSSGDNTLQVSTGSQGTHGNALWLRLREEERRRIDAEDVRDAYRERIAALERATDHMSELVLHHRMSFTVAQHLSAMGQWLRVVTEWCESITMIKSRVFADEMVSLVRRAQHTVFCGGQISSLSPTTLAMDASSGGVE